MRFKRISKTVGESDWLEALNWLVEPRNNVEKSCSSYHKSSERTGQCWSPSKTCRRIAIDFRWISARLGFSDGFYRPRQFSRATIERKALEERMRTFKWLVQAMITRELIEKWPPARTRINPLRVMWFQDISFIERFASSDKSRNCCGTKKKRRKCREILKSFKPELRWKKSARRTNFFLRGRSVSNRLSWNSCERNEKL